MSETNAQPNEQQGKLLVILWGALFVSILFYGIIAYVLAGKRPTNLEPKMLQVLLISLGSLALVTTILIFGIIPRLRDKLNFMSFYIIRWALAESIAIYGLVLFLLGISFNVFLGFLGWATLLMLLLYPKIPKRQLSF